MSDSDTVKLLRECNSGIHGSLTVEYQEKYLQVL